MESLLTVGCVNVYMVAAGICGMKRCWRMIRELSGLDFDLSSGSHLLVFHLCYNRNISSSKGMLDVTSRSVPPFWPRPASFWTFSISFPRKLQTWPCSSSEFLSQKPSAVQPRADIVTSQRNTPLWTFNPAFLPEVVCGSFRDICSLTSLPVHCFQNGRLNRNWGWTLGLLPWRHRGHDDPWPLAAD